MSVLRLRSWASFMMIALYLLRSGSLSNSRRRTPSVMYLITVCSFVWSSNWTEYPTVPHRPPILSLSSCFPLSFKPAATSLLTRFAMLIAATLLGCVHPTMPYLVYPS